MITLNDISFLIVTRANDISRLKLVCSTIRVHYPSNEIIIIYDDVPIALIDDSITQVSSDKRVYVSGGYNLALKYCTRDCFVFLHDDTIIGPNFLENIIPLITPKQLCNFTTVEPPLYGNVDSIGRPIRNFGRTTQEFNVAAFNTFCEQHISKLPSLYGNSPYGGFFMAGYKKIIDSVGGFDELFQPYFHEDDDLMMRLYMAGYTFIQSYNSIVYHMGSLTSRVGDEYKSAEIITRNRFVKKWKTLFPFFKHYTIDGGYPYQRILVEIHHENCSQELISILDNLNEPSNIKISVNGNYFTNEDLKSIYSFPYLLKDIEVGTYSIGTLIITVV